MRAITFCLFSFTVFSQLTTCSNSTNCYTSLFFFFFASSFTATLHQTCWKALHLKSCIVDRSYVLFVILSIVVLYEFLCKHCFISRDCYIARSIFLFYTAAFAKGVLFPTSHYFFFFLVSPCLTLATLPLVLFSFLSLRRPTVQDDLPHPVTTAMGSVEGATEQPRCLYSFSPTLLCILALRKHLCHTMVESVFVQVILPMFIF